MSGGKDHRPAWHQQDAVELPHDARSAREGRRVLRQRCGETVAPEMLADAELLLSEVITNALRYGQGRVELAVECSGEVLRVHVRNEGAGRPRLRQPRPTDQGGRGLVLLDALSAQWGVYGDSTATVVWFSVHGSGGALAANASGPVSDRVPRSAPAQRDAAVAEPPLG